MFNLYEFNTLLCDAGFDVEARGDFSAVRLNEKYWISVSDAYISVMEYTKSLTRHDRCVEKHLYGDIHSLCNLFDSMYERYKMASAS